MKDLKIFVISLPAATERRESVQAQFRKTQHLFTFFDAIEGEAGWRCFAGYDDQEYCIETGRRVLTGEIGCYASHLTMWLRCIELDESIVIMEDDADLQSGFATALASLGPVIDRVGFVRLDPTRPNDTVPIMRLGEFSLSYCRKYPHGTRCYAISPAVAQQFVVRSEILSCPVDKFIKKYWEHNQPLFALEPAPVLRHPLAEKTSIGRRAVERQSARLRMRRMIRKASWFLRRAKFNAAMIKNHSQHAPMRRYICEPVETDSELNPRHAGRADRKDRSVNLH